MARVPRDAFVETCRDLDGASLAAFVADLFAARGRTVERDGQRLVVTRGGHRQVCVVDPERPPDAVDADLVVRRSTAARTPAGPPADREVLDLTDLYRQLNYAVDPETTRALAGVAASIPLVLTGRLAAGSLFLVGGLLLLRRAVTHPAHRRGDPE